MNGSVIKLTISGMSSTSIIVCAAALQRFAHGTRGVVADFWVAALEAEVNDAVQAAVGQRLVDDGLVDRLL